MRKRQGRGVVGLQLYYYILRPPRTVPDYILGYETRVALRMLSLL